MLSVKVSSKNQISLPSEARKRLGIEPGERLTVEIRDDELILRRRPARASDRLRGLGKGLYGDPVEHVRRLRDESEERLREREEMVRRDAALQPPSPGVGQQRADLPARGRGDTR